MSPPMINPIWSGLFVILTAVTPKVAFYRGNALSGGQNVELLRTDFGDPLFSYISPDAPSFLKGGNEDTGVVSQNRSLALTASDSRPRTPDYFSRPDTWHLIPGTCSSLFSSTYPDAPPFLKSRSQELGSRIAGQCSPLRTPHPGFRTSDYPA
jgi:hypothetical protein